jgi:GNAT superfamily N-acetyltransferase
VDFLETKCSFRSFTEKLIKSSDNFECQNDDLNDFFLNDCINYSKELLGKSYCFTLDEDETKIVCAFTISNDSIKVNTLPNSRKRVVIKAIPRPKQFKSYPAVLIGRLGVNKKFGRQGIGTELMDFIKSWFIDKDNKTGCRFIVVDSYNTENAINYYLKNNFVFLFSTEQQEKEHMGLTSTDELKTRLMFFDLITLEIED